MMVKTSSAMVADERTRPGMSGAGAFSSFEVGMTSAARMIAAAATGAMAMKMLAQLKCSSSQPPTSGPMAMATPAIAPHRPMARPRSLLSVKTLEISDSVAGKVMAAPSPITDLAAMSCAELVVKPPTRLAVPNTASPARSMPLRPNRSDRLPNVSSSAAKTRLNESTTHCSWVVVACSSRTMAGSATLTRVVSRLTRNAARRSAVRISGFERIVEILRLLLEKVNQLILKFKYSSVSSIYAQLRPVLLDRQGARCRRRPVDVPDHPGAPDPRRVPVHRPEERAAGHRDQPALRPDPRS